MDYRRVSVLCIACGTPMVEWRSERGQPLDLCETCGGVWMNTADFLVVLREHQPRLAVDELPEHNDGTPRRPCPCCGERMAIVWLEYLQLDQCAAHGVWFDAGELDRALGGDTQPAYLAHLLKPRRRATRRT
jgi:Zn-finger nucleic acid-binding protein